MQNQNNNRGITPDTVREYTPWTAFKRLAGYIRPFAGMAVFALVFSILSSLLLVARPYLVKIAVDNHITTGNLKGFDLLMIVFLGLYFIKFAVDYALNLLTGVLGQKIMHDLRMDVFGHILSMEMSFFDHNQVGRLMTRTTDDVSTLNDLYTTGAVSTFNNLSIIAGIIGVMFYMDWKLAVITLTVVPLLYLLAAMFANKIRIIYRIIRKGTARLNAFLQESILGMRLIQLMRRTDWSYGKFSIYSDRLMGAKISNVFYYGIFFPLLEFIGMLGLALILISGGHRIFQGTIQIGVLIAFIRLVDMFFWPIRELAENFNTLLSALASSERIFTLLDTKARVVEPARPLPLSGSRDIVFDRVWFAYEGVEWVLRDVSFRVAAGERVAFVGPSGAGKTSIINLLLRFYDVNQGSILIGGRDIRGLSLEELHALFSHVGQDSFLFNRSVADNIRLDGDAVSRERIQQVLSRMGSDRFFEGLEDGLDTIVMERGSRLSQGQRQLVSFARALAADREILVLDEATASVDTFTESLLQKAVPVLMEGRTSIVIAHRLSTVRNVDRIHVLARGKIRETGTHAELLKLNGIYAKLSRMHFG
ncbi:MAG: ABC transporter ATP-binding protein [Candidatus Latescibacter sp.]|nr:ABC transporter ATP-binding protein [Candidatus Latescibacter sp.]